MAVRGPPSPELTRETDVPRTKTATAEPSATDVYALGRDPGESARLQRQAEELRPDSASLFDRVGLRPGQHAIDLGCGPRGILDLLAERVAPGGSVVGVDADPGHVAMAREYTAQRGLVSVQIVAADARCTGLPPGSFDLVHARTLLVNVPDPAEVLAEMVRLARPGGWVASLEPDVEGAVCYPAHPAYTRMWQLFRTAFGRHGADLLIGRRLAELYRGPGCTTSASRHGHGCASPVTPAGRSCLTWYAAFTQGSSALAWPTRASSPRWITRSVATSTTPAPWSCPTCPSSPGAASRKLSAVEQVHSLTGKPGAS
jgi:SAM-dependent methyltransferase